MKNKTDLTQQTSTRLRLSPTQVRFVHLLEMNEPEIEDAVRNELDENPALEAVESDNGSGSSDDETGYQETAAQMQAADYGDEDDMPAYLLGYGNGGAYEDDRDSYVERQRQSDTLMEWLNSQLDMVNAPKFDIDVARYLVGYLDDNGRLARSLKDIAEDISSAVGRTVTRADLQPALDIIRYQLDPPGLGAVDLRECLLIQLRRRQPKTLALRVAEEIVAHNFDLFTKKHYDKLRVALGVDNDVLEDALDIIRLLDPKPGTGMSDGTVDKSVQITPDFIVVPDERHPGHFSVSLNHNLPELAVEESFVVDPSDKEARMFVRRKRAEATTFIGLMRRRSETLMSVMKAIVSVQWRFFETEDASDLNPMILNDIAEMTGFDRSVVSRATSGKYVATRGGIYPLKMFFNDNPYDDSDASSVQIVAALRKIIDEEDKKHPLSDRALTDALNGMGYTLARRTVTKYREKNNIPVARLRKEI